MLHFIQCALFSLCISMAIPTAAFAYENVIVVVDTTNQSIEISKDGVMIKNMLCSTGLPETPTPLGTFTVHNKEERIAWTEHDIQGKDTEISYYFITQFNGHIGFHSTLFGAHPLVEAGEKRFQDRLPSSLGCVRMRLDDAAWIHENIGIGTTVIVR